ncbi:MAG: aspartate carbamoyltransferase, partial [Clostridia bacterium]|nr:aspartate carbamoyltransferase [Clostridia bacterium]
DDDPRACYFKQVKNGKLMRMALILKLLGEVDKTAPICEDELVEGVYTCKNPRCITSTEQEIKHIFKLVNKEKNIHRCIYCEKRPED